MRFQTRNRLNRVQRHHRAMMERARQRRLARIQRYHRIGAGVMVLMACCAAVLIGVVGQAMLTNLPRFL